MSALRSPTFPAGIGHGLPLKRQLLKDCKLQTSNIKTILESGISAKSTRSIYVDLQRAEFKNWHFRRWGQPYLTIDHTYEARSSSCSATWRKKAMFTAGETDHCARPTKPRWRSGARYEDDRSPSIYVNSQSGIRIPQLVQL